ncbi:hypothetical protein EC991_001571 [Linnemannia zychae]|nr:hypothetical protein EC991_001571 [Linnemannia zychae]
MSHPPVAIDPAHVLAYISPPSSLIDQQDPNFLNLFQSLHPPTSSSSPFSEGPLRLYIVQQPAPAKHRRSYVEIKDLRALCGRDLTTGLPVTSSTVMLSDLKDSVLVMRRIPDDGYSSSGSSGSGSSGGVGGAWASVGAGAGQVLTEGTLASYQHEYISTLGAMGMTSIEGSTMSTGSDGAQGSSDESSSTLDDDLSGAIAHAAAGMGTGVPPHLLMGADHVTSWMSNNTFAYLSMCLSMGHSDSDQSDTQSLPPPQGDTPHLPSSPVQEHGTSSGYGSDGGFDDDEDDDESDTDEGETREGKRSRAIRIPRRSAASTRQSNCTSAQLETNPNHTLPQWFRPLVKDGEVQFEIWVVAFLKPQLLPTLPSKPATGNGASLLQQHDSQWTEAVNELLDSSVLQQFVRSEVANGRIGIDFKRIMADKKDRRKATRRVIR